jgi:hypothetical protein
VAGVPDPHRRSKYEVRDELASCQVRIARDTGALAILPLALTYRSGTHVQLERSNTRGQPIPRQHSTGLPNVGT